jgi:hypothetical protein
VSAARRGEQAGSGENSDADGQEHGRAAS